MALSIRNSEATNNENLREPMEKFQSAVAEGCFNAAGLAIGTSSKKAVKIANTTYFTIGGALYKKTTAEVAFTATTHDVTNAKFRLFVLSIGTGGTVTITAGVEGATLAAATVPAIPVDEAILGMVIINPTGTGNFDATSTDLDDATVAPNAVYIDTESIGWNPNCVAL